MTRCTVCHEPIPAGRLDVIPGTTVCTAHSHKRPRTTDDVDIAEADAGDVRGSMSSGDGNAVDSVV